VPVQLPIGSESSYLGIIDLMTMQAIIYNNEDMGKDPHPVAIPAELLAEAQDHHDKMVELIAETDDELTMRYLEGGEISVDELKRALRVACIKTQLIPILCGSALKNKGVQPMLDAVLDYLPSPLDVPPVEGLNPSTGEPELCPADENAPFAGLVFKIVADPFVGRLAYIRIYSGKLESGTYALNSIKNKKERVGRLLLMHANHREDIQEVYAGDIAAVVGLKDTFTADTLCSLEHPIILEQISFPEPVITQSIEPKTKADQDKMTLALVRLAEEDPTFRVRTDQDSGQTIISGMGELHLEVITDRMRREYRVEANVGRPQVAYRETITREVTTRGRFVRQTGGRGMYGDCEVTFTPNEAGKGYEFINKVVGGTIPKEYIGPIEKGIREALDTGGRAGYPVVDIIATLIDGSFHPVDSNEMAFTIAGSMALKEAVEKGRPVILEPIMRIEVITPEQFLGDVIGDLNSRRGHIESMDSRGNAQVVRAFVPLANMFGYVTDLRSSSQGRASSSMEFDHYAQLPQALAEELVAKVRK
jgi:elongation factor G